MLIIQKDKYQRSDIISNLLNWYDHDPSNGTDWYAKAFEFCTKVGEKYNVNPIKVAGIVSALSPQKNWEENKRLAVQFIETGRAGQYGMLVGKAQDILELPEDHNLFIAIFEILNGLKISSFFMNIVSTDYHFVTIDRHIISASVGYSYGKITNKGYEYLSDCIIECARIRNVHPKVFQAVVWCNFRDMNVRKFEEKVPF